MKDQLAPTQRSRKTPKCAYCKHPIVNGQAMHSWCEKRKKERQAAAEAKLPKFNVPFV